MHLSGPLPLVGDDLLVVGVADLVLGVAALLALRHPTYSKLIINQSNFYDLRSTFTFHNIDASASMCDGEA